MKFEKIRNIFKTENVSKVINIALIILIGVAGYYFYQNSKKTTQKTTTSTNSVSVTQTPQTIVVDIGGAVKKPGVYDMDINARIVDIIEKAGGFTDQADQKYIDKNINKAQKLSDGLKIYIPSISELMPTSAATNTSVSTLNGLVSINNASKQDLVNLPEIGEVTADKIISSRPFNSINDLVTKGCLKQTQLDKIKDKISV